LDGRFNPIHLKKRIAMSKVVNDIDADEGRSVIYVTIMRVIEWKIDVSFAEHLPWLELEFLPGLHDSDNSVDEYYPMSS